MFFIAELRRLARVEDGCFVHFSKEVNPKKNSHFTCETPHKAVGP